MHDAIFFLLVHSQQTYPGTTLIFTRVTIIIMRGRGGGGGGEYESYLGLKFSLHVTYAVEFLNKGHMHWD